MGRFHDSIAKKIVSAETLSAILRKRKADEPKTVTVFTNGCFDLLHQGHVDYLSRSRDLGDLLVVGLNSDRSVQALKGPSRPIAPQESRAAVLAALACVDFVVLFDEETPLRLIETLTPDILVKGGDYSRDTVVGADWVESHGGRVALLSLVPGLSTTRFVEKMQNNHPVKPCES